ncbi:MAG: WD40 repeat domain-containing protein [Bradymonadales bacterium]|jgi:WD40 repeat protein
MSMLNVLCEYNTQTGKALALAFSPDDKLLAVGAKDGCIHVLDAKSAELKLKLKQHYDFVFTLDFEPDTNYIVSSGKDKTLRVWDPESGNFIKDYAGICSTLQPRTMVSQNFKASVKSHKLTVLSVKCAEDGYMATGGQDNFVKLWKNGDLLRSFDWHDGPVVTVAFRPEQRELYSASKDRSIRSWDEVTGAMRHKYLGHKDELAFMRFLHSERFVSADVSGHVLAWSVYEEKPLGPLANLEARVQCGDALGEKNILAVGLSDGRIVLLDTEFNIKAKEKEPIETIDAHTFAIRSLAFSHDGSRLASCDNEGSVKIWELKL